MTGVFSNRLPAIMALVLVLALLPVLAACGDDGAPSTSLPPGGDEPARKVTITVGNLSDLTGPAAAAMTVINMALEDIVRYYNDEDLIPGIALKVVTYDGQYRPSNNIPGYEWLKERGADLIFSAVPGTPETLKPFVDSDRMVLFGASASPEGYLPPGYSFCGSVLPVNQAYTFLRWLAENDWDYRSRGPAKIAVAGWTSPMLQDFIDGVKGYCEAHPDQFVWKGDYLTNPSVFSWQAEVEAMRTCDYVYPPFAALAPFAKEFRKAGGAATFLGGDPHVAYMGLIADANIWKELDGMLLARDSRWWNEQGELIDLTKELLNRYRPDMAGDIAGRGSGYLAISNVYQMIEAIKRAVETVGAENFNSEALYEATQSFVLEVDGYRYSYGQTKRFALDYIGIYELRAEGKDVFRADPAWQPVMYAP